MRLNIMNGEHYRQMTSQRPQKKLVYKRHANLHMNDIATGPNRKPVAPQTIT